jgi:hypothetical protein
VTPYRHIVLRSGTPLSRSHREIATGAFDAKHRVRGVTVKLPMQPLNEVDGCGLRQVAFNRPAINFCLHADVSGSLDLKIPASFVPVEFTGEGTLDVARTGIVAFNEIAVVRVHDAHEIREM